MRDWERIREKREDLTDYVIHFTKPVYGSTEYYSAKARLAKILRDGYIRPTFAPMPSRYRRTPAPTIKGPDPAVCLTEQPLWAFLETPTRKYSGYGIAYHKVPLFDAGGRAVLYGSERELGGRLREGEDGWEEGKEIYAGGLPRDLQYLWARYAPIIPGHGEAYPVDFTWEREWRIKPEPPGLPIVLSTDWYEDATRAIIVERDEDVPVFRRGLKTLACEGQKWAERTLLIVSLETAREKLKQGDRRYGRIDTWPRGNAERVPPNG